MRAINVPTTTTVTKTVVNEQITKIVEDKTIHVVIVTLSVTCDDGSIFEEQYNIDSENYLLLMSVDAIFGVGKQKNEYREQDLMFMIVRMRG